MKTIIDNYYQTIINVEKDFEFIKIIDSENIQKMEKIDKFMDKLQIDISEIVKTHSNRLKLNDLFGEHSTYEIGLRLDEQMRIEVKDFSKTDDSDICINRRNAKSNQTFQLIRCQGKGHPNCCLIKACHSNKYLSYKKGYFDANGTVVIGNNNPKEIKNHWKITFIEDKYFIMELSHTPTHVCCELTQTQSISQSIIQMKKTEEIGNEYQQVFFEPVDESHFTTNQEQITDHIINTNIYQIGIKYKVPKQTNSRLEIRDGSELEGEDVIVSSQTNKYHQLFQINKCTIPGHENCCLIKACHSGKYIGCKKNETTKGSWMIQSSMNAQSNDHHWKFVHVEDKYYYIVPCHSENEQLRLRIVRSIEDETSFQLALFEEYLSDSVSEEKKLFEQKL